MATAFELLQQGSNAPNGSTAWEYMNDLKTGNGGGTGGAIIGSDIIMSTETVSVSLAQTNQSIILTQDISENIEEGSTGINLTQTEVNING